METIIATATTRSRQPKDLSASGLEPGLQNRQPRPVPLARLNTSTVWMAMCHNVFAYETTTALMARDMKAWQAIAATAITYLLLSVAIWFDAVSGTRYGLPFCLLIRPSFGPRRAQRPVLLRSFIAVFWFAVQAYAGSEAIDAIDAIIGYS